MPSEEFVRTVRRIGATLAALLALTVVYLAAFWDANWADSVGPVVLVELFPWLVFLVAVGYLLVSYGRSVALRLEPDAAADPSDETTES